MEEALESFPFSTTREIPRGLIGLCRIGFFEWHTEEVPMLYYALAFLVVGLIAGVLNLTGVAAIAVQISWILFVIGIVLVVIHLVTGRSTRAG